MTDNTARALFWWGYIALLIAVGALIAYCVRS